MQKKKKLPPLFGQNDVFAPGQSGRTLFKDSGGDASFTTVIPPQERAVEYVSIQPRHDTVHQGFNYANAPQRQSCSEGSSYRAA